MASGVRQFTGVEQDAWLDQADQVRDIRKAAAWPHLLAVARRGGVQDLDDVAAEIGVLGDAARRQRLERDDHHVDVRIAADASEAQVARAAAWIRVAHLAVDRLRAKRDPRYPTLVRDFYVGEAGADSLRAARNFVAALLDAFDDGLAPASMGLDAAFVTEGRQVLATLSGERGALHRSTIDREQDTDRLATLLARLVDAFDELIAIRNLVEARTGERLVGLELAYLRAAEGPAGTVNRTSDAPAASSELPPLPPVVGTPLTLG